MNIVLWVLQVLLAVVFLAHGWLFLAPPAELVDQMNASLPRWFQLFLGVAEVLAAIGLTLPGLTRVLPWLVTWAAGGIIIVTLAATVYHLLGIDYHKEYQGPDGRTLKAGFTKLDRKSHVGNKSDRSTVLIQ